MELVDRLDAIRLLRNAEEQAEFITIVDKLVAENIMPAMGNNVYPSSAYEMVKNYGSRWFAYRDPIMCHKCKYDLRDKVSGPPFKLEIYIKYQKHKEKSGYYCPKCHSKL